MKPADTEQILISRSLPDLLPPEEGWVVPHYDGLSLANLPATLAALLANDLPGALPTLPKELWSDFLPGLRRIVLIVFDGLGYRMLRGRQALGEGDAFAALEEAGRLVPLTSVFPSTTDAVLVSLRTGCPPAQHGWLAYNLYLRELGMAINAIMLCPIQTRETDLLVKWGLDPATLVALPALAERLAAAGVHTGALLHSSMQHSGFTKMLYRGVATVRGHHHASDFWVQLRQLLAETRGRPAFLTAYWGGLDTVAHVYGPDGDQWEAEFRTVSHLLEHEFLRRLPAEDRDDTLLLLTADHGQVRIPADQILTADKEPGLNQHLMAPVVGESRAAFVYPRPGRSQAIRDYLAGHFPGWFTVLDSAHALEAGLLGKPIQDEASARAGELLVLPRGRHALQATEPSVPLIGRHGGLTPDEMLVPLIGARLGALP